MATRALVIQVTQVHDRAWAWQVRLGRRVIAASDAFYARKWTALRAARAAYPAARVEAHDA